MQKYILTPKLGQIIKSKKIGIQGVIVYFLRYDDIAQSITFAERERLEYHLGSMYRERYYEVVVVVQHATKDSEYKQGEEAILDWLDVQNCETVV